MMQQTKDLYFCSGWQTKNVPRGKMLPYRNSFWGSDRTFHFMVKLVYFPHILSYHKFLAMSPWGPKEKKSKKKLYLYQVDADSLNPRLSAL